MRKILFAFFIFLSLFIQNFANEGNMTKDTIVCIETTDGTIEIKLKNDIAPKTCENFTKVIKNFMIQSGDPTGTGRGGQSVWGKAFEDEVRSDVSFDKPFILAMANAGPNTNGSQFFITTVKTPWLNQNHTIFGEVIKGEETIKKIESSKTDYLDKPIEVKKIIKAY